jgi:hypothetical protein
METRRLAILASMIGLALLSASEEPAMASEPDPITPVEASQTAPVTAPAAVGATAGIITEQDFTGDGTLDLKADNGIPWIQVNRDTVSGVKGFVDAGGISGQSNFMNSPLGSDGMVDQVAYWQTVSFTVQILTNTAQMGAYKVTDVEQANGKEVTKEYTLTLEAGREYAEIEYRFTNTGLSAWLYNEYPSHIHDGAHLTVMFPRELTDIEAYINGVGVINLPSLRWWASYTPSPTEPFAVVHRPSSGNAMTFGFTAWDYAIHQIVAYYTGASPTIEPHLDLMATAFTLNPGGSAHWKALLAFHTGGYARGAQIYSGHSISGYSISGRVTDESGSPMFGVTISAGSGLSATTDASGYYTFTGLISGTYTLTPTPTDTSTPTPTPTHMIWCTPPSCRTGEVYCCPGTCPGGCGTQCATVTPTPTPTPTRPTSTTEPTPTPTKGGYTFSPPSRTVSVPPCATGQDFTGTLSTSAWFYEPFSTDIFGSGDWTRSDSSVSVDTSNGWLHMEA